MHSISFVTYLWNCETYRKSILDILFLSINFVLNLSCSDEYLLIYTQDMPKNTCRSLCKISVICWQVLNINFIKIHSAIHVVPRIQMERHRCNKHNRCFIGLQTWSQNYESYNKTLSFHIMSIFRNFFTTSQNPPFLPTATY